MELVKLSTLTLKYLVWMTIYAKNVHKINKSAYFVYNG